MAKLTDKAKSLVNGLSKDIPSTTTNLLVNGQVLTVKQIIANLTAFLALVAASAEAKVQARQAAAAVAEQTPQLRVFSTALAAELRQLFGKGNPVLANFGIAFGKKTTPAKVKAAAADKAQATRKAKRLQAPAAAQVTPAPAGSPANGK